MPDNEITNTEIQEFKDVYSPSSLLGVYAAALRTPADGRILLARGAYQLAPNQREYSGYFYDSIKSLNENKFIKSKTSSLIRHKLENNAVYTFKGFIEKRVSFSAIELVFVIDDILQKEENTITEEEVKRFAIIQRKLAIGFHDFEALVKEFTYKNELLRIANLYGNSAQVDQDFKKGIAEASVRYKIAEHRCSFGSKTDIINSLKALSQLEVDAIAIVRGGGDPSSLEIFNDPDIAETVIGIRPLFITALGHTFNDTLLDKVSDKKFALPHDYGNSLKVWVDAAVEEQSRSKSVLLDQVKRDVTKTFTDQLASLQNQLQIRNKEFEQAQIKFKEMTEQNHRDKADAILTKEKAFDAQVKSLQEQLKAKEDSVKSVQMNYESTIKNQIGIAIADIKAKHDISLSENERLKGTLAAEQGKSSNFLIYIIIGAVIGLVIGLFLRGH
jgi:exodeoxyribonuclease VII large subunit